jgi:ATP-dependent helicase/nuclease subunit B
MPVRFVIGRAGTGKSRHILDAIVSRCQLDPLGPAIYWILPKQATFTAERELACASGLPAVSRARVVSFEQLGRDILAECGGVSVPQVTALGRRMLIGHLLRQLREDLKFYRSVSHPTGLATQLDETFAEFERSGKGAEDLDAIARSFDESSAAASGAALSAKLHDLHLLYRAYSAYLGQERLDPHRRLQEVLTCVHQSKRLHGAAVYVDGFYDFTDYQRKFLCAVAKQCDELEVALTLDPSARVLRDVHAIPDEMGMFHPIEDTYRKLWFAFNEAGVELGEPVILHEPRRFRSAAIAHAEACLFARKPHRSDDVSGIELIEAPDRRAEVDAVARHIRQCVIADKTLRLRDIAVLVRDLEGYYELIDASFREHGLRWFADRRRPATHHPLIQFTRALPALALHDWDHDAVITMLKSGLAPLALDASDRLENYVLEHRLRGAAAWTDENPWTYRRELLGRDEEPHAHEQAAEMDLLRRRLVDPLLPFVPALGAGRQPLRDFVAALLGAFEACQVRGTLQRWKDAATDAGRLEQGAEQSQVWNDLLDLLDEMVELLGDQVVAPSDFVEILESGLETFDLALTPPTVDQVLVGSVDRTRTPALRMTIVMGLNEGSFPRCPCEDPVFSDSERRTLAASNVQIDPQTRQRLFDERFLCYVAFTRAGEHLYLTRPRADDEGRPLAPSQFWTKLRAVFPNLAPKSVPRDARRLPECIGTPRQLVTALLHWARGAIEDVPDGAPWRALYLKLASYECCDDAIDVMRFRAWRALAYDNAAVLSSQVAGELFKSPLDASVSRIETYACCPFRHFARYGLKLQEREDQDVTALDLGNVYHGVLERLVRDLVDRRQDFATAPREFTDEQIRLYSRQIGEALRGELMLSSARNKYLLGHVERTLGRVVEAHREAAKRGSFRPWKTELPFGAPEGSPDSLPALELGTPDGRSLRLHGRIDRVDLIEEEAAAAVIDYKLSGNELRLQQVYHGLSLQLLTYLLVLQRAAANLGKARLTPAAAFYVQLLRKLETVGHPAEAIDPEKPEFHLKVKPRGVIDRRFFRALDTEYAGEMSQVVQVQIKKDGALTRNSDALEADEFAALLRLVERKLGELADQIMQGDVRVAPYRIGITSPCPRCEYRSVCRFEPARDGYRTLTRIDRAEVIKHAMKLGDTNA